MKKQTDVLVIGGGFGGVGLAQKLSKNGVSVTLVDRKNYFEVTFAMLRNVANPKLLGKMPRKLYGDFIDGAFIQGSVESMNDEEATLSNGEVIRFKRAIISSGSRYPSLPLAKSSSALNYADRNNEITGNQQTLASAKSVLVIGGGVVGVELAGEIASAFPDKKITLAHSSDTLLDNLKPKAQRKALEQLTARGVRVKFNRRFTKDGNVYRCSKSNEVVQVDMAYACIGMVPNTEFLKAELPGILDENGLIKVDSFMKVKGYENLYSLGDCATLDSNKHGYIASVQGAMLADALLKSAKGKKVKPYKTPTFALIAATGTDSGVAQMPFGVTTARFIVNLKQKDMGISNMYKIYGSEANQLN